MVEAYSPSNLRECLRIMEERKCSVFAGGTDLMIKKKSWTGLEPNFSSQVVFICDLEELKGINVTPSFIKIGSCCTCTQIMEDKNLSGIFKDVFRQMASPSIRNIATVGGNICNASPAGDSLPLLYALDAVMVIESNRRKREIPINEFILGPGKNVLEEDEILTQITIPIENFTTYNYQKVGTRKSTALSKLSFTGLAKIDDGRIDDIRISFGAVGPVVIRSRELEKKIIMKLRNSNFDFKEVRKEYAQLIKPIDDQRSTAFYRKETCLRLLEEFVKKTRENVNPL